MSQKKVVAKRTNKADVIPEPTQALISAMEILGNELNKLRITSFTSEANLSDKQLNMITRVIETLASYQQKEAHMLKTMDLSRQVQKMSDEELQQIANQVVEAPESTPTPTIPNLNEQLANIKSEETNG